MIYFVFIAQEMQDEYKQLVTAHVCANAHGDVLPPLIIYPSRKVNK